MLVLAVMTISSFTRSAYCEESEMSKEFSVCFDKSNGITVEVLNCLSEETKRQDRRLNAAYQALSNGLSVPRKSELRNAQRIWISFRKLNCGFYLDPNGGTMASVSSSECFMTMTANRAKELEILKLQ
jgi:uncharacterized protein YecT (DUF1311 family)